jgi:hypothetical protein
MAGIRPTVKPSSRIGVTEAPISGGFPAEFLGIRIAPVCLSLDWGGVSFVPADHGCVQSQVLQSNFWAFETLHAQDFRARPRGQSKRVMVLEFGISMTITSTISWSTRRIP